MAEVAVGRGHHLLVAYSDGTGRYLNHAGSVAVIDDVTFEDLGMQFNRGWACAIGRPRGKGSEVSLSRRRLPTNVIKFHVPVTPVISGYHE